MSKQKPQPTPPSQIGSEINAATLAIAALHEERAWLKQRIRAIDAALAPDTSDTRRRRRR